MLSLPSFPFLGPSPTSWPRCRILRSWLRLLLLRCDWMTSTSTSKSHVTTEPKHEGPGIISISWVGGQSITADKTSLESPASSSVSHSHS